MKFLAFGLLLSTGLFGQTKLMLVGGGKRPVEAMSKFVEIAGKENLILIIPWASESTEGGENILKEMVFHGATKAEVIPLKISSLAELKNKISRASGIFFTGGDQNKLMKVITENELKNNFRTRFKEEAIFGGTSAGTAIMSDPMLSGKGSELTQGLGLLPPNIVVDQHFIVRQRWQRLANIVLSRKGLGIGIDEDNALFVVQNIAKVIGPTQVQILKESEGQIVTTSFENGEVTFLD